MYVSGGWDRTLRLWFEPPGRQARAQPRRGPWAAWGALGGGATGQARRPGAQPGNATSGQDVLLSSRGVVLESTSGRREPHRTL